MTGASRAVQPNQQRNILLWQLKDLQDHREQQYKQIATNLEQMKCVFPVAHDCPLIHVRLQWHPGQHAAYEQRHRLP